jgi:hypothetical protein
MTLSPTLTYKSETKTRADWARSIGLPPDTLAARLNSGWSIEAALETPSLRAPRENKTSTTHNGIKQVKPEYQSWRSMMARCSQPNHHAYSRYGGAGITVCSRWQSYTNFYEDMGDRPESNWTLERIDNNQGYTPCNCYWAPRKVQNQNKADVKLSYALAEEIRQLYTTGRTQKQIADYFGISRSNVSLVVNNKIWT